MDSVNSNGLETTLLVRHEHGLHARPADLFVRCANSFESTIGVYNISRNPEKKSNAKSILGVLSLGVRGGDSVRILAEGTDATAAIEALTKLIDSNFED
jgi:phosphocarrier protein